MPFVLLTNKKMGHIRLQKRGEIVEKSIRVLNEVPRILLAKPALPQIIEFNEFLFFAREI